MVTEMQQELLQLLDQLVVFQLELVSVQLEQLLPAPCSAVVVPVTLL